MTGKLRKFAKIANDYAATLHILPGIASRRRTPQMGAMTSFPPARFLDRTTPPHLATLMAIASISALNLSIFLPSLTAIAADLDADYQLIQLAVTLYLAMTAVVQLIVGPISDRYGRRPVMLASIGIFAIGTLGCIYATNAYAFLFFRMVQAAIVSGMVLSRAIVRDIVGQDKAASLIGYVTMGMTVMPMIGPVLGGFLEEVADWRATFWVLIVFAGLTALLTWADLGETFRSEGLSLRDQAREYPELLRSPRFWGYSLATTFTAGAFFGFLGGAPYVGAEIHGLGPTAVGLFFIAPTVGYFIGNGLSGRYTVRLGAGRMMAIGIWLTLLGLLAALVLDLAGVRGPWAFFPFCGFIGVGNGMVLPSSISGSLSVRPHLAGTASGLGGTLMIGGGAAFSAIAGLLLKGAGTPLPLTLLMLFSTVIALACILLTNRRERRLASLG